MLEWLLDGPSACAVWTPGSDGTVYHGSLYRDPYLGLTVLLPHSWEQGQEIGPVDYEEPVLMGRTHDGQCFSLHHVVITSTLDQAEIRAAIGYLGDAVPKAVEPLDTIEVHIDWLHQMLDVASHRLARHEEIVEIRGRTADAVTVEPGYGLIEDAYSVSLRDFHFELRTDRPIPVADWLNDWIDPLVNLVAFATDRPTRMTVVSHRPKVVEHPVAERSKGLQLIMGAGWPTLDVDGLYPPQQEASPPLLASWRDEAFDLSGAMKVMRSVSIDFDDHSIDEMERNLGRATGNYLATVYHDLNPDSEFLNLVQALEALHVRSSNNKKVQLSERIADFATDFGSNPVDDGQAPSWLSPAKLNDLTTWEQYVAKARHELSHGGTHPGDRWLRRQIPYIRALVEFALLQEMSRSRDDARNLAACRLTYTRHHR